MSITRRSFMAAVAAAMSSKMLFTPRIQSRTLPDLSPFCDPHSLRYDLSKPWNVEGLTIASNARVIVVHPDDGGGDDDSERKLPSIHVLDDLWSEFDSKGFNPLRRVTVETAVTYDEPGIQLIEGRRFRGEYMNKLKSLGEMDVKVLENPDYGIGLFRWGNGGKAILMGLAN